MLNCAASVQQRAIVVQQSVKNTITTTASVVLSPVVVALKPVVKWQPQWHSSASVRALSVASRQTTVVNSSSYRLTIQSSGDFKMGITTNQRTGTMAIKLTVPNMACSACSDTITHAIQTIDPAAMVQADPKTKLVVVETQTPEDAVRQAIVAAGYAVS
jgi:copper chaperone